jgi:hypothetical protein
MATEYDRERGVQVRSYDSSSGAGAWIIAALVVATLLGVLYLAMSPWPSANTTSPTTTSQPRVTAPPENTTVTPTTAPVRVPSTK